MRKPHKYHYKGRPQVYPWRVKFFWAGRATNGFPRPRAGQPAAHGVQFSQSASIPRDGRNSYRAGIESRSRSNFNSRGFSCIDAKPSSGPCWVSGSRLTRHLLVARSAWNRHDFGTCDFGTMAASDARSSLDLFVEYISPAFQST